MAANCRSIFLVLAGYTFSAIVGHFVVGRVVNFLWHSVGVTEDLTLRPIKRIRFWHGIAERCIYTSAVILGKPEAIAVWLAFKALMRWKIREDDPRHIPGSSIYMIGTALNIALGVFGGFIARWKLAF